MKITDYAGLNHFEEYFKDFRESYVVVGGFATLMLLEKQLEGHGKVTQDIDLVLLTTASIEMAQKIKLMLEKVSTPFKKEKRITFHIIDL